MGNQNARLAQPRIDPCGPILLQVAGQQVGQGRSPDSNAESLASAERKYGRDSPIFVNGLENLAEHLRLQGNAEESVVLLQEAVSRRSERLGPEDPQTAIAERKVAYSLGDCGRHDEAASHLWKATRVLTDLWGPDDRRVVIDLMKLGDWLTEVGRFQEPEEAFNQVEEHSDKVNKWSPEWSLAASARLA